VNSLFRAKWLALFALLVFILGGSVVRAQDATGRIVGNVTDPSGSPILGAQVNVTNVGTKIVQTTTTDATGFYQVLSLPIGEYEVAIESQGFRKEVFANQKLQISQSLRLDAKLAIGQTSETVEVTTQAANVETVNQTVGASVIGETIQRAPLNGRNVLDLAALQPGVTETNPDSGAAGKYSVAGGRSDSVTYLLDGALNNDLLDNGVVYNPNPDTIAEFRIMESDYSAEYGRNGGGVVSVVTKSGTNEWHGSAFEFLRNDAFNANTFFNKVEDLPRDVLKRNQYGATFGGPIHKDKFFFFVGYQGQRLSQQAVSGLGPVFTPEQIGGDFSNGGVPGNCPNAVTGVVQFLQANPYFQADPAKASCGMIDPTKFNSISQKYISAGWLPTDPSGSANYQGAHTDNNNEVTGKLDFLFSEKDKLSVTLGGFRNPTLDPFNFATVPGFPNLGKNNHYILNGNYYHNFTPNVVNEFRAYTQRTYQTQDFVGEKLPTASDLGFGVTPDNPTGPVNMWFDTGLQVGFSENGPTSFANNTFGFQDTISWIRGKHNFKFGGGLSAYQNNTVYDYYVNGEFDFYSYDYGQGPATGNVLADFLLGAPSQLFQYPAAPSNIRSKAFNAFFQDEWRIKKNFSLNLGIRYEYNQPKLDTQGRSFSIVPGLQSSVFTGAPVGMLFPGDKGAPVGTNFPDKNDWAPRIGFAWDPKGDGKTSIRGGFGVFYDVLKGEDNLQFNGQPPFFSSTAPIFPNVGPGQASEIPFFSDPFGSSGVPNPFPSKAPPPDLNFLDAGFLPINAAGSVYVVDPHLRTPYTYQYNLSLQREIAHNTVLEVSYVGSSSHGLTSLIDVNPFTLGTTDRVLNLTSGNTTCTDSIGFTTSGADPAATCSFAGLPEFKNVTKANYNSLQVSVTRQIADTHWLGRTYFTFAYTFAHSIDNVSGFRQRNSSVPTLDPNLFRSSSDQDIRHRITLSGGWDLPFDRMWSSGPKRLTQGWSVFPVFTWHSGLPYDVFANLPDRYFPGAEGTSGAGDPYNTHANIVGPLTQFNPRTAQTFTNPNSGDTSTGNYWFNPNSLSNAQCTEPDFVNPPPVCTPGPTMLPSNYQVVLDPSLATYGSLPRNFLRGPGYINFDMAFAKTTAITERTKLEFRAEFFNLFNHANFLNPGVNNLGNGIFSGSNGGSNPNSSLFGQITSTYDPRIIQLALRLTF
jgi:Carboxypeptidase regulatory-like domain/TonB-dependent Receptor Plug Domain